MLILKSASPRRKQIFENLGLDFSVKPSSVDENQNPGENDLDYLRRVTIAKLDNPAISDTNIYVSSDTIVVMNGKIFPKPEKMEVALESLRELNGKTHEVKTGMAIFESGKVFFEYDTTEVEFYKWSEEEIQSYATTYKPLDKAGSYGIQDKGGPVKRYSGSYSNVMGFPIRKFFLYQNIWTRFLKA